MAVVAMMPFLSGVDRQRGGSRVWLPGFLKPPLIAGGIHDARRTTPRQGRGDIREFNHADEKQQGRGEFGVTFHGSTIAHSPRHGLPIFRGHRWTIPRWTGTDNSHKRDLPTVTERPTLTGMRPIIVRRRRHATPDHHAKRHDKDQERYGYRFGARDNGGGCQTLCLTRPANQSGSHIHHTASCFARSRA